MNTKTTIIIAVSLFVILLIASFTYNIYAKKTKKKIKTLKVTTIKVKDLKTGEVTKHEETTEETETRPEVITIDTLITKGIN